MTRAQYDWKHCRGFHGGPVVKNLHSQCKGHRFGLIPGQGTKIPLQAKWWGQKERKKASITTIQRRMGLNKPDYLKPNTKHELCRWEVHSNSDVAVFALPISKLPWNKSARTNSTVYPNESLRLLKCLFGVWHLSHVSSLIEHNNQCLSIPSPQVVFPECTQFILSEVKDVIRFLSDEIIQKGSSYHMQDMAILIFDSRKCGTDYQ